MSGSDQIWPQVISGLCVWAIIGLIFFYKLTNYLRFLWIKPLKTRSTRSLEKRSKVYESLVICIFSRPSPLFRRTNNEITIHLLHREKIRFNYLTLLMEDSQTRRDIFGNEFCKFYNVIITNKIQLPYITKLRACHQSGPDLIFFEGIEVLDYNTNRRIFYSVKEYITGIVGIKDTVRLRIKPKRLNFVSKELFCVSFENPLVPDFGQELIRRKNDLEQMKTLYGEDVNAVVIPAKWSWFESTLFYALLINSLFLISILILCLFADDMSQSEANARIVVSIVVSGFVALAVTELLATIFINYIKHFYEHSLSKSAIREMQTKSWLAHMKEFRAIYLVAIAFLSIMASIITHISISSVMFQTNSMEDNIDNIADKYVFRITDSQFANNLLFFLILFTSSLVLTLTLWIAVFGCLRFCYRLLTFTPKPYEPEADTNDTDDRSETMVTDDEI